MDRLKVLGYTCDILQTVGLVIIFPEVAGAQLPAVMSVLYGIIGFSFLVDFCLPVTDEYPPDSAMPILRKIFRFFDPFIGAGFIIWAFLR